MYTAAILGATSTPVVLVPEQNGLQLEIEKQTGALTSSDIAVPTALPNHESADTDDVAIPHPNLGKLATRDYESMQNRIWESLVARQSQEVVTGVEVREDVQPTFTEGVRTYYRQRAANVAARGSGSKGWIAYITDLLCALKQKVGRFSRCLFLDLTKA